MTVSRLWRVLGADQPVFQIETGWLGPVDDHQIHSLTVDAGTTMAGMTTSSATVELSGHRAAPPVRDNRITIALTDYGADRLANLTGQWPEPIRSRFTGRPVQQTMAHNGPDTRTGSPKGKRTTLTAQDWAAFILQLDRGGWASKSDPSVGKLYRSLWVNNSPWNEYTLQYWGSAWHWVKLLADDPSLKNHSADEVVGRYAADLGNLIRQDRNGQPTAWSHDHIVALGQSWKDMFPDPLQASQVLAPVEWSVPASYPTEVRYTYHPSIGATEISEGTAAVGTIEGWLYKRDDVDMTHIYPMGGHSGISRAMTARAHRESGAKYRIQSVTVDVLGLIRRNQGTDRAVVGYLLAMTHGDPWALGADWGTAGGGYYVQRITHKITPGAWTVDLDLVHSLEVAGINTAINPTGRTWDTAYRSTQWDNAPDAYTWETTP